jgi:hypothetical protein
VPARRTTAALVTGAIALASFGAALPSGAQSSTTVTFTVSGSGGLAVSTAGTATLGAGASLNLLDGGAYTGTLPNVTVTDNRATLAASAWSLQVAGGDFTNQQDNAYVIPDENARIFINTVNGTVNTATGVLGGMVVTASQSDVLGTADLGSDYVLATATGLPLVATQAAVTPTMRVTVPAGAAAGTYTGTVTYTAS